MNIRRKTLLALGITFIVLISIIAGISVFLYVEQLLHIEQQETIKETKEVISAISNEQDDISITLHDWSYWNDTYKFVLDRNQDYVLQNLDEKSLSALRINLFMLTDSQGNVIYVKLLDPVTGRESQLPEHFNQFLPPGHPFFNFTSLSGTNTGILLLPAGPIMIASSPVFNNNRVGPSRGVLVMGRYLNERVFARVSRVTGNSIYAHWNDDGTADGMQLLLLKQMNPDYTVVSIPRSDSIISGYTVISDINGQKILIGTDKPRNIFQNGITIIQTYLVIFIFAILVTLVIVLLVLDQAILKRLNQLTKRVRKIGLGHNVDLKPELTGNDEIAQLEQAILSTHTDLMNSEEEFRSIFDMVNDGIHISKIEPDGKPGKFIKVNKVAYQMLQYTKDELLERGPLNIISVENSQPLNEIVGELSLNGHVIYESVHRRKDGTVIPVEINAQMVQFQGKLVKVSVVRDITERKKAEEDLHDLTRGLEIRILQRTKELEQEILQRKTAEATITLSLNEKEILLREIHHRVKNNLQIITSLIRLQKQQITDPDTVDILLDSESRIRSMALVHEKLYSSADLASIDFSDYTKTLANSLINAYAADPNRIRLVIDIKDVSLDINRAIPVGLIMNELVANALKHAFPKGQKGEIVITGRRTPAGIVLSVQDNGAGLPDELDWKNTSTLGLHLVITLIKQVGGSIELNRSGGTTFEMIIPSAKEIS
jgi:PAS domain S-box-containing protein